MVETSAFGSNFGRPCQWPQQIMHSTSFHPCSTACWKISCRMMRWWGYPLPIQLAPLGTSPHPHPASAVDWACTSHRVVLNLTCMEATYTSTCLVEASHGGLIAANGGENKVNQDPRLLSEHQIVWTIPSNCGLGGIIGVCYFSHSQLFCLLPASWSCA